MSELLLTFTYYVLDSFKYNAQVNSQTIGDNQSVIFKLPALLHDFLFFQSTKQPLFCYKLNGIQVTLVLIMISHKGCSQQRRLCVCGKIKDELRTTTG